MERYHVYKIAHDETIDYGGGYSWDDVMDIVKGYKLHDWFGDRWLSFERKGSKWSIFVEHEK